MSTHVSIPIWDLGDHFGTTLTQSWNHFGSISAFKGSPPTQANNETYVGKLFDTILGPNLDNVETILETLAIAISHRSTSRKSSNTIETTMFSMVLRCRRCPKTRQNCVTAEQRRDPRQKSTLTPKLFQAWKQNDPTWVPKWFQLVVGAHHGPRNS